MILSTILRTEIMELNTTMSVLHQFSFKEWHRLYTSQKHKFAFLVKTTCYVRGFTQVKLQGNH